MKQPKIGLLPLYLELYDKSNPEIRKGMEDFYNLIATALREKGIDVVTTEVCRLDNEFKKAVKDFEKAKVDALVTLHLAYSPSLESIRALKDTDLPILILDTTPDYEFGADQDSSKITFNHGIHGVQDMCNLLIREGKSFEIEAGHWKESDVLDRITNWINAASLAGAMRQQRIGRIGDPFKSMGDFSVPQHVLRATTGVETVVASPANMKTYVDKVTDSEIDAEIEIDKKRFTIENINMDNYRKSVKVGLGVRKWLEAEKLTGFTVNFLAIDKASGLDTVPFLEASKAISRGLGYGGEGDVLTAALVGALAMVFPETTFTEMFCPDWKGNRIFLSHMGEMNIALSAEKPVLRDMKFPYTDADNPVTVAACYKGGEGSIINLAPGPDDTYSLVIVPLKMIDPGKTGNLSSSIRGWFKTSLSVAETLEQYSKVGGTHHSALVYGDVADAVAKFGKIMGWTVHIIG